MEKELKIKNPSAQDSVTNVESFIKDCWMQFYSQNDAVEAPEIKPKTMARCMEAFSKFAGAEPGRKKK